MTEEAHHQLSRQLSRDESLAKVISSFLKLLEQYPSAGQTALKVSAPALFAYENRQLVRVFTAALYRAAKKDEIANIYEQILIDSLSPAWIKAEVFYALSTRPEYHNIIARCMEHELSVESQTPEWLMNAVAWLGAHATNTHLASCTVDLIWYAVKHRPGWLPNLCQQFSHQGAVLFPLWRELLRHGDEAARWATHALCVSRAVEAVEEIEELLGKRSDDDAKPIVTELRKSGVDEFVQLAQRWSETHKNITFDDTNHETIYLIVMHPDGTQGVYHRGEQTTIGRAAHNTICQNDPSVAMEHCVIFKQGNQWYTQPAGEVGYFYLNTEVIVQQTALSPGDIIHLGNIDIEVKMSPPGQLRNGPNRVDANTPLIPKGYHLSDMSKRLPFVSTPPSEQERGFSLRAGHLVKVSGGQTTEAHEFFELTPNAFLCYWPGANDYVPVRDRWTLSNLGYQIESEQSALDYVRWLNSEIPTLVDLNQFVELLWDSKQTAVLLHGFFVSKLKVTAKNKGLISNIRLPTRVEIVSDGQRGWRIERTVIQVASIRLFAGQQKGVSVPKHSFPFEEVLRISERVNIHGHVTTEILVRVSVEGMMERWAVRKGRPIVVDGTPREAPLASGRQDWL